MSNNVLLLTDLEGIVDVFTLQEESISDLYTSEVQFCIDSLLKLGVERITVCDTHSNGDMIKSEIVSDRVKLVSQIRNISFDEKYDCAVLVGFHGMERSQGILSHTFRFDFKEITVNGVPVGEVEVLSRWLGFHGVPVILVIGDREATYEANCFNVYRSACCVKSVFQSNKVNLSILYEKIKTNIQNSLSLDKTMCLSSDNEELRIEFYNIDIIDRMEKFKKEKGMIIFKNCTDFIENLYELIGKLNDINLDILKENQEFVKDVRKIVKGLNKEKILNSKINELLNKNLFFLDSDSRRLILKELNNLDQKET